MPNSVFVSFRFLWIITRAEETDCWSGFGISGSAVSGLRIFFVDSGFQLGDIRRTPTRLGLFGAKGLGFRASQGSRLSL